MSSLKFIQGFNLLVICLLASTSLYSQVTPSLEPPESVKFKIKEQPIIIPGDSILSAAEDLVKIDSTVKIENKKGLSCQEVEELVDAFDLREETVTNPHLSFLGGDISYWCKQELSKTRYELEFAARRIVLSIADLHGVIINDQGDLSWAAQQIMAELLKGRRFVIQNLETR